MNIRIDPSSGVPIYIQIIEEIKVLIAGGILAPGDQLPSVRALAVSLRVNPNTVSKAYQEMERDGLTQTRRGEGTFVTERKENVQDDTRLEILREKIADLFTTAEKFGMDKSGLKKIFDEIMTEQTEGSR